MIIKNVYWTPLMAVGVEVATLTLARPYSVLSCQRGQGFPCTVWVCVCVGGDDSTSAPIKCVCDGCTTKALASLTVSSGNVPSALGHSKHTTTHLAPALLRA